MFTHPKIYITSSKAYSVVDPLLKWNKQSLYCMYTHSLKLNEDTIYILAHVRKPRLQIATLTNIIKVMENYVHFSSMLHRNIS